MTNKEAEIIIDIMMTADRGCKECVTNILSRFLLKFTDSSFNEYICKTYKEKFNKDFKFDEYCKGYPDN